jgi:hypothetical protein
MLRRGERMTFVSEKIVRDSSIPLGPRPDTGITLSELLDGQLRLFEVPLTPNVQDTIRSALEWLVNRWQLRLAGGLDSLPYTSDFDTLYDDFTREHGRVLPSLIEVTRAESRKNAFWMVLLNLRKSGRLRAVVRRNDAMPLEVSDLEMSVARSGMLLPLARSDRERLPYTAEFAEIFGRFQRECHRRSFPSSLNRHGLWRVVVRIMKSEPRVQDPELFDD